MKRKTRHVKTCSPDFFPASDKKRIFLSSPHLSEEGCEIEFVKEAFRSNWLAPLGPNVERFEKEFAAKTGAGYAAAFSSGTAAMHMSLRAAGIRKNKPVFCQSLTFAATANPVIYENAFPVFIDSDYETWNMCPEALEAAFRKYSPEAVVAVHLYGIPARVEEIACLCRRRGVPLIEDAAESLGALCGSRHAGTIGDFGVYSFNSNKIITTSGGGMLVSGSRERIEKAKFWASQSRDGARHYQHSELGFNYGLSNVLAGIGIGQLKVLDERLRQKKRIFEFYERNFAGLDGVKMMPRGAAGLPNFWLSCITLNGKIKPLDLIIALERENIEARPLWKPLHLQPFYRECGFIGSGVCEDLFGSGVCLPSDTKMTEGDLERVAEIVKNLWKS